MDGGLGASIYDILKSNGVTNLYPITVGTPTTVRDRTGSIRFANVRAAVWWNLRDMLNADTGDGIMLPPLEVLEKDLIAPRFTFTRDNLMQLESKDSLRDRIGKSTDYGDAVCLAFWNASRGGGVVF